MAARCSRVVVPGVARSSLPERTPAAVTESGPATLGPERRLPDKAAFDHVFSAPDIRYRRHPFSLLARRRETGPARLGLVIGKRHARRAVDRNLIRRLLREEFRIAPITGIDVIILARPGAADLGRSELREAAHWLFARLSAKLSPADTQHGAARDDSTGR